MELSFIKFGEKGQKIVFLHGWQQDKCSFSPLVPFLFKEYHLFFVDLPGFGQSLLPKDKITISKYSEIVTRWLFKNKLSSIILVGHSFGGKIASVIAYSKPEIIQKLILISPSGIPTPKFWHKIVKFIPLKIRKVTFPIFRPFLVSRDYKNAGKLLPLFKNMVKEDLRSIFAKIKVPTLIIWGKQDQELPINQAILIHKLIKSSQLKFIDGNHLVFQQEPKIVARLISNFIEYGKV